MAETGFYNVSVTDNSYTWDTGSGSTTGTSYCPNHYCWDTCYHPYTYWWWPYTYPTTIYKYQIKCPKCGTMNWLELDTITTCTKAKCGAKLKAVTNQADYEVPVNA